MKKPNLTPIITKSRKFLTRNRLVLTCLLILAVVSFVVWRVNNLTNPPTNQERLDEQSQTLKKVRFDEEAIKAIRELRDSRVRVKSKLPDDRNNPFNE